MLSGQKEVKNLTQWAVLTPIGNYPMVCTTLVTHRDVRTVVALIFGPN